MAVRSGLIQPLVERQAHDREVQLHQDVFVRTTIDLPDDRLIEQGLRQPAGGERPAGRREPPPVIISPRGVPIPAVPRGDLRRFEEEEDEERHARSARR